MRLVFGLLVLLAGGCGRTANPEVCCTDPADCSSIGAAEDKRDCPAGLACIDHECVVADCSTQGCTAQAPVCNVATNVCEGCSRNPDCANTGDQPLCDVDSGSCVQCNVSNDCGPTVPVCVDNNCRKCERDAQCASGACGEDGSCVLEQQIVYTSPIGADTGPCNSSAPCRTLTFAVGKTTAQRSHVVMRVGSYATEQVFISETTTTATPLFIHGNGSTLTAPVSDGAVLSLFVPATVRDLHVESALGTAIAVYPGPAVLDHVTIRGLTRGLSLSGNVTVRNFSIEESSSGGGYGVQMGLGTITLENGVIYGWLSSVKSDQNTTLYMTNVLAHGATGQALDIPLTSGDVRFSTIADAGADSGSGPRAVSCAFEMTVANSIVWAPGTTARPALSGCSISNSIVGPTAVPGASNADPMFVDASVRNYHLKPGSPGLDVADTGPASDFEGDPRPQGARYDIGADEGGQ
jgi:hypothetical protein